MSIGFDQTQSVSKQYGVKTIWMLDFGAGRVSKKEEIVGMVHDLVDTFPRVGGTKPRVGGTKDEPAGPPNGGRRMTEVNFRPSSFVFRLSSSVKNETPIGMVHNLADTFWDLGEHID
jgi:hypothetical protein